ncbi:glycoside hydrolase family 18 protein [Candidatus Poribacteria bacterium]|nr:glycoside hydrolase family 18 protein [Candidatus Poribacteria bacterium]
MFSASIVLLVLLLVGYRIWEPGKDVRDGHNDRLRNGIWLQHGWLGDDSWFSRNGKEVQIQYFRSLKNLETLAASLRERHILYIFPHMAPTSTEGDLSFIDPEQARRFFGVFSRFKVMPWVGGIEGKQVFLNNPAWRENFAKSIGKFLREYPAASGIHINIEPMRSGNQPFLALLEEVRRQMPQGRTLSIAAYPPSTLLHPYPDVHWNKGYYKEVAARCDLIAVMMYDTALPNKKLYRNLMAEWTRKTIGWSKGAKILLGLPTYHDADSGYHNPKIENLENALLGVHAGLDRYYSIPETYEGVSLYCEWEMDDSEWRHFEEHFLKPNSELVTDPITSNPEP